MKKKVWLSIKGQQSTQSEEPEIVELITEGELYLRIGATIYYARSSIRNGGTTTTVKVEEDQYPLSIGHHQYPLGL